MSTTSDLAHDHDGQPDAAAHGTTGPGGGRGRSLLEHLGLVPSPPAGHLYHAFISYNHAADGRVAPALQRGLQRFAKPWYRARALRTFRDDASLSANPALWDSIVAALGEAEHYILLASPGAAASKWVAREADHWRSTKSPDKVMIALTAGSIQWDEAAEDFDWERTDALPRTLQGAFTQEPRVIDLRWTTDETDLSLTNERFREAIADLAAPLHGVSKDELAGEEILQQRRTIRIARTVAAGLAVLSAAAIVAAVLAILAQGRAVHQQRLATSRAYAAESLLTLSDDPQLALLIAEQSARVARTPQTLSALRAALPQNHLLHTLPLGAQAATSASWSSDGTLVAASDLSGGASVFDARTGALVRRLPTGSENTYAEFSPAGSTVLTWGASQGPRLWSARGSAAPITLASSGQPAAFSRDGRLVAAAMFGSTGVWDARTGARVATLPTGELSVFTVDFAPDGRRLLIANGSGATVWDLTTSRPAMPTIHPGNVNRLLDAARFSPDGREIVTTEESPDALDGAGAQTRLWDAGSGRALSPLLPGWQARFSPGGGYLAVTNSGVVDLYTARNGSFVEALKQTTAASGPALFSPDTSGGSLRYIATGSKVGTVTVWNAQTATPLTTLSGQQGEVTPAVFSADGGQVLTWGSDGTARIWDSGIVAPQPLGAARLRTKLSGGIAVKASQFTDADPGAPVVAYPDPGNAHGTVALVANGTPVAHLTGLVQAYAAFDRAGRVMLITGQQGHAFATQLRSVRGGGLLHTLSGPGSLAVGGAVSPDGGLLATVDATGIVSAWDAATGRRLAVLPGRRPIPDSGQADTLKFSPDGRLLLVGDSAARQAVVWRPRTNTVLNRIRVSGTPSFIVGAISPDDRQVATGADGADDDLHLYPVGLPSPLLTLVGHSGGIFDVAFSPNGTLLATTSPISDNYDGDNTVRVWSPNFPHPLLTLSAGVGTRVDFSPDGHSLITNGGYPATRLSCVVCGGFDYLLGLARQRTTRQLTPAERQQYLAG